MTWAMCFNCGATKFGAICPCPECQISSTGDMSLDIAFSDHNMSKQTLEAFGKVVRSIRDVCDDDQLRFWSFIHYVSTRHPDILGVKLTEEQCSACEEIIAKANPTAVSYEESDSARTMRELEKEKDNNSSDDGSD